MAYLAMLPGSRGNNVLEWQTGRGERNMKAILTKTYSHLLSSKRMETGFEKGKEPLTSLRQIHKKLYTFILPI